jgi:transposase
VTSGKVGAHGITEAAPRRAAGTCGGDGLRAAGGVRNPRGSITRVGERLGINPETRRNWVERTEIDGGRRPGTTSDDRKRIAELEREVRELRRANEFLKAASAYFARELDPRFPC